MFPYRDDNPTFATPVVTIALIAVNVLVWVVVQGFGNDPSLSRSVCQLGLIPGDFLEAVGRPVAIRLSPGYQCVVTGERVWYTPLTSMFLHGSWFHIIGNMWFFWIFGNNVEDSMGRARFLVFYLLCGLAAAGTQIATSPDSVIPMVGASGAIGGVMGAYVVLYPRVRVHLLVFLGFFVTTIAIPAIWMLGYWFLIQLLGGLPALSSEGGGVAFWAHVGGFLAGAVLILVFRDPALVARHRDMIRQMAAGARWRSR
ncbi:MAG: rhomboid family intramembrane serine protease [Gemmatimonadales bacterium]